ncbi:MAG: hypothetical protein MZU95_15835 [Desulfomicrobium escambiense]|nr:hypothetical protein [Desulfomicrobium escambiense]
MMRDARGLVNRLDRLAADLRGMAPADPADTRRQAGRTARHHRRPEAPGRPPRPLHRHDREGW